MKKYIGFGLAFIAFVTLAPMADAATLFSQSVLLSPGWNIVSTPRVLDSHSFSATENSTNFDIYVLDASSTTGWLTMAQAGQAEFTPLYGYFINNKTGADQTLTFNYKSGTTPNQRLFERKFTVTGWYSFGVANPSYALVAGAATTTDTNNPSSILNALVVGSASGYDTVVDFTNASSTTNINATNLSDQWKAVINSDVNTLNDFRETKGYAIYIKVAGSLFNGSQNDGIPQCSDGLNNDGDGNIDYPADIGCTSPTDNSESGETTATVSIANASSVASQNVAVNVSNQPLGGFTTTISGEAVSVPQMNFYVATSSTGSGLLTNVSLYDESGAVVAGPVDATYDTSSDKQKIRFTDTITFSTGTKTFTLKGKIPTSFTNNGTTQASTNPSGDWTGAVGQTTGSTVSLTGVSLVNMNTMTVKTASLTMGLSTTPSAQTIVAGGQSVTFANIQLDASQSGEDVRVSSIPLHIKQAYKTDGAAVTNITACKLYDGSSNVLNSGSNVVNSLTSSNSTTSPTTNQKIFSLDNSLTIPKGTVVTIALKCDVGSSATSGDGYTFGVYSGDTLTFTGVTSGNSGTATISSSIAGTQTIAQSGSVAVSTDSSSPSYAIAAGGTTGMTMGVAKFRASNEAANLTKVGLTLVNGTYSGASGAQDLVQVYIYNGQTLVGTATFTGNATTATSTLLSAVSLPKDTDTKLTIKADLADVGASQPGTQGDLIKIDVANFEGSGASSGTTILGGSATGLTSVSGVRLLNTYPTVAQVSISSGSGSAAAGKLIRFSVNANSASDVGINRFTFSVATSTGVTIAGIGLYAYTDSGFSTPISGQGSSGLIGSTVTATSTSNISITVANASSPIEVPSGSTYYFELRGSVGGVVSGSSITTTLLGDSTFSGMLAALNVAGNFAWSPNVLTTSVGTDADWTNGASIIGLPSSGLTQTVTQ